MKILLLLTVPALVCASVSNVDDLEGQDLVDYINGLESTWQAELSPKFELMSKRVRQGMMGVQNVPLSMKGRMNLSKTRHLNVEIPESFDSRTQWPYCRSISQIRDQSACGSCWAFGAVEAMSDRTCIASRGKLQITLSADDLMSCCHTCGYGCDGGEPLQAWEYWRDSGIVTGTNHSLDQGCRPYPFPSCEHHNNRTRLPPCHHTLYPTPKCDRSCQDGYRKSYHDDKHYGKSAYGVHPSVEAIQKEIMTFGPVEAAFEVYADFLTYKSGVYQHHGGKLDGGHAIRILGWGEENGSPYWLIANSWNTDWGDHGYFKILRGSNECGIESGVVGGEARVNHTPKKRGRFHHLKQKKNRRFGRRRLDMERDEIAQALFW